MENNTKDFKYCSKAMKTSKGTMRSLEHREVEKPRVTSVHRVGVVNAHTRGLVF